MLPAPPKPDGAHSGVAMSPPRAIKDREGVALSGGGPPGVDRCAFTASMPRWNEGRVGTGGERVQSDSRRRKECEGDQIHVFTRVRVPFTHKFPTTGRPAGRGRRLSTRFENAHCGLIPRERRPRRWSVGEGGAEASMLVSFLRAHSIAHAPRFAPTPKTGVPIIGPIPHCSGPSRGGSHPTLILILLYESC